MEGIDEGGSLGSTDTNMVGATDGTPDGTPERLAVGPIDGALEWLATFGAPDCVKDGFVLCIRAIEASKVEFARSILGKCSSPSVGRCEGFGLGGIRFSLGKAWLEEVATTESIAAASRRTIAT
jgi:hypothetical protein